MNKNKYWSLKKSIFLFILALLFVLGVYKITSVHQVQMQVADKVLRFHVLANSNRSEDQELKLAVRDCVGTYVREELAPADSLEESCQLLNQHLADIEACAMEVIREQGYDYTVTASLETCFFPEKTYGRAVFPPGNYKALRVVIGEGSGRNWWCVLYPNLCFSGNLYQVDETSGAEELQKVLAPEEYKMIMENKEYQISFRLQELWEKRKGM